MEKYCKYTCGWCPLDYDDSEDDHSDDLYCMSEDRTINFNDYDYESDYDYEYPDEPSATVQEYPISIKKGKYSIYGENGSCQVFLQSYY